MRRRSDQEKRGVRIDRSLEDGVEEEVGVDRRVAARSPSLVPRRRSCDGGCCLEVCGASWKVER